MAQEKAVFRCRIDASAQTAFDWHERPGALERLTPPWENIEVIERSGGIKNGGKVVIRMKAGPLRPIWRAEHYDYQAGKQFRDRMVSGPLAAFDHLHRFEEVEPTACFLEDRLEYRLRLGWLGQLLAGGFVRRQLARTFEYRHNITINDIAAHQAARGVGPMRILISGASGLVGNALIPFLTTGGHEVIRLVRHRAQANEVRWDPLSGSLDHTALEGIDAVIHLAGDAVAEGSWTSAKKALILDSRVNGTRLLSEAVAKLNRPPNVFLSASAIGYYGNRGDEVLREDNLPGQDFLARVCQQWEEATTPLADTNIRLVKLRIGLVLSPKGGALSKLLTPFQLGLGGRVAGGDQYMSWISLDDTIGAIHYCLTNEQVTGAVNLVAPNAVTNQEFTKTLGKVLSRPTIFPVPAFVLKAALGAEKAETLLLSSARVQPATLLANNYQFRFPELEGALRHLLGK